jgi:hypothetical protein
MERRLTVEFGPSRSKRFAKAVAEAQSGPGECRELEPDRYRVSFNLGTDAVVYVGLARLLQRVRDWRATEVYEGDEPLPAFHTREMAWCASSQLKLFGECRFRFSYGVLPRCALCPLLEIERAVRDMLGENPLPGGHDRDQVRAAASGPHAGRTGQARSGIRRRLGSARPSAEGVGRARR